MGDMKLPIPDHAPGRLPGRTLHAAFHNGAMIATVSGIAQLTEEELDWIMGETRKAIAIIRKLTGLNVSVGAHAQIDSCDPKEVSEAIEALKQESRPERPEQPRSDPGDFPCVN